MPGRRKINELKNMSIWDEALLTETLKVPKHRIKLWNHLIYSLSTEHVKKLTPKSTSLYDIPYIEWNFPRKAVDELQQKFNLFTSRIVERNDSARGDTTKLLIELQDGHQVETVIMRHTTHNTVCISSQIGCQMGCK
jgi:hypothetical protein